MITETMLLVALRQKNWSHASEIALKLFETKKNLLMRNISHVAGIAETEPEAEYLLSLWSDIRWKEINKEEVI